MQKKSVLNALVVIIVIGVSIQMAHADLKNGLLAYYPFNGNANDESGNGNNGTVNDATLTTDRFDNENASYVFNNDPNISIPAVSFIKIQDSRSLKPDNGITISVWVNALNKKGRTIIAKQYGTSMQDSYVLWYETNGTVAFSLGDGTNSQPRIAASLLIDEWSHVVGVWDGSLMKLYLNSIEVAVLPFSGNILYDSNPIFIGADNNNNDNIPDEGWNGFIDDIRIYNRNLSESEIKELYEEQPCNCPETGYDEGYQAGKQFCIDNPTSCGWTSKGFTQADLDAKYQEGYNAGCTSCSNGSTLPATISPELKMHIPVLQYVSPFGAMDLWADFEYAGDSNGNLIWKLTNYGQK